MNTYVRKMLVALLILGFGLGLGACNTMRGLGKDTEVAGEKIQEEAERHIDDDDDEDDKPRRD